MAPRVKPASRKPAGDKPVRSAADIARLNASLQRVDSAADKAAELLIGGIEPELQGRDHTDAIVRSIARRVGQTQARLTGGNTLETMARLRQDSLLNTPVTNQWGNTVSVGDGAKTLKNELDAMEASAVSEIFSNEKARLDDYQTYHQITDLITQASEAVQCYTDNIVSPDNFTKRDLNVYYEALADDSDKTLDAVRSQANEIIQKYNIEDRSEDAITISLTKGDAFIAVFNLRQELEGILNEDSAAVKSALFEHAHAPSFADDEVQMLAEAFNDENPNDEPIVLDESFAENFAIFMNETVVFREDASQLIANANKNTLALNDLPIFNKGKKLRDKRKNASLSQSKIRGSIVKLLQPENVIKLHQEDTNFGYFYIETDGLDIADFARRGTTDQTAMVRAIDQNMSTRTLSAGGQNLRGKEALISRLIVKTLAKKMGNADFLINNEEFAFDAYTILARARREKRRVKFTYVASDQMVHFTPNGAVGYGTSVLSRVKFLAKLYIGAMTNAFMRNSIRRPERLVWYIDVGVDNDGSNAIQNFIRTIKQKEVKFSNLRDITTTINQIGEFHDFYIPTYNGERPVEVETLNMGAAAEVDNPYLEFLRKSIIGGTGVPAAYVGYSEEVAFARSLTMDNGRFLRRVVRHQKHYSRAATRLIQILWRNEYESLDEIHGKLPAGKEDGTVEDTTVEDEIERTEIDISKIVVRYPVPATLNTANIAESINQVVPVAEFVAGNLVPNSDEDGVKANLQARVAQDLLPQIPWERYKGMLDKAREDASRAGAIKGGGATATSSDDTAASGSSF